MPNRPYSPSSEELSEIRSLNNVDWYDSRTEWLRKKFKEYLKGEFKNTCFFCGTKNDDSNYQSQIEHIVSRSFERIFTFHPENLVIICPECNRLKRDEQTLANPTTVSYTYNNYPRTSNDFLVVHPYIDNYDDHIEIEDDLFYKPVNNSYKGLKTISIYSLFRLKLVLSKARKKLLEQEGKKKTLTECLTSLDEKDRNRILTNIIEDLDKDIYIHNAVVQIGETTNNFDIIKIIKKIDIVTIEEKILIKRLVMNSELIKDYTNIVNLFQRSKRLRREVIDLFTLSGFNRREYIKDSKINPKAKYIREVAKNLNLFISKADKRNTKEFVDSLHEKYIEKKTYYKLSALTKYSSNLLDICIKIRKILQNTELNQFIQGLSAQDLENIESKINILVGQIQTHVSNVPNPEAKYLEYLPQLIEVTEDFNLEEVEELIKRLRILKRGVAIS